MANFSATCAASASSPADTPRWPAHAWQASLTDDAVERIIAETAALKAAQLKEDAEDSKGHGSNTSMKHKEREQSILVAETERETT